MAGDTEQLVADGEAPVDLRLGDDARDALAEKIGNDLASAISDDVTPAPEPIAAKPDPAPAPIVEPKPVAAKPADASAPVVAPAPEDGTPEEAADDGSPTLPEAYRRSAHARGWQDSDIDRFWKADTELALRTFDGIHQSRNAELAQFAQIGRTVRPDGAPAQAAPVAAVAGSVSLPSAIDAAALIEQYGNPDMVNAIVGPVNQVLAALNAVLPEIQAGVQLTRETQMDNLGKQIEGFFTAAELEPYQEVYGKTQTGLTPENKGNRAKVLELADAIRAGALHQGRDMSVQEALDAAHHSVASEFTVKTVRRQIQSAVEARGAAVTLKPKGGTPAAAGKVSDSASREAKVAAALAGVFGGN
ncbi:MAG: hypothetical protein NTW96_27540 [Planctomycetia bacterium]|nr:hypothetical protein [Planctomycetia bacterium]